MADRTLYYSITNFLTCFAICMPSLTVCSLSCALVVYRLSTVLKVAVMVIPEASRNNVRSRGLTIANKKYT